MNTENIKAEDITIKATGEVFIIPNRLNRKDEFLSESVQSTLQEMADINDITEENSMFVECWIVSDELNTENLRDHGGHINDDDRINIHTNHIPSTLFIGKKEDDIVTIKFPATLHDHANNTHDKITLEMKLTLSQLKYRYRNHGKFEECFERLTRNCIE